MSFVVLKKFLLHLFSKVVQFLLYGNSFESWGLESWVQFSYLILVHKCSFYNWFIASCDSSMTPCNDVGNAFVKPVENECKYAKITYVNCG